MMLIKNTHIFKFCLIASIFLADPPCRKLSFVSTRAVCEAYRILGPLYQHAEDWRVLFSTEKHFTIFIHRMIHWSHPIISSNTIMLPWIARAVTNFPSSYNKKKLSIVFTFGKLFFHFLIILNNSGDNGKEDHDLHHHEENKVLRVIICRFIYIYLSTPLHSLI